MKFKVDENLPVETADILQKAGHEADTVYMEGIAGADDATIAQICKVEKRALITLDLGFSDRGKLWIVDEKRIRVRQ